MQRWQAKLAADQTVLIDGGTGSELKRRGVAHHPVAWSALASLTHPDILRDVHVAYLKAGAEVIITNTFAGARFLLDAAGHADRFEAANRRAVELAIEAREVAGNPEVAIAGSMSNVPPGFDTTRYPDPAVESRDYEALAAILCEAGVDLLATEMLQELEHAPRVLRAATATGLPVWLGISCRRNTAGTLVGFDRTDIPTRDALTHLLPLGPDVVNVMHTPVEAVLAAIEVLRSCWTGPIGVYPETEDSGGRPHEYVAAWRDAGAGLFGGCCGTTPAEIEAMSRALR